MSDIELAAVKKAALAIKVTAAALGDLTKHVVEANRNFVEFDRQLKAAYERIRQEQERNE